MRHEPARLDLTDREQRVRRILLRELARMNNSGAVGLTYAQRKHLVKALDADFIQGEITRQLTRYDPHTGQPIRIGVPDPYLIKLAEVGALITGLASLAAIAASWGTFLIAAAVPFALIPITLVGTAQAMKARRRKVHILQALRALCADPEADDVIDRAEDASTPTRLLDLLDKRRAHPDRSALDPLPKVRL
jgi:hypothetical protein